MADDDGLIDYTLGKAYGENAAGRVIRVDLERAAWLDGNGYQVKVNNPEMRLPSVRPEIPIRLSADVTIATIFPTREEV